MKKGIILFILIISSVSPRLQVLMNKDSLLKLLPFVKEDSAAVELYISIGQQYDGDDPAKAKYFYRKAGDVSKKINYYKGIIRYINNYTYILNMEGKSDSSLALNLEAVKISRQIDDSLSLGKSLINTGTSYREMAMYEEASTYYEEGKRIIEHVGDPALAAKFDDILQVFYFELEQYDKAIKYGENAVGYFRKADDKVWLGSALNNLGMAYQKKLDHKKSLACFEEALSISLKINNLELEGSELLNIGDVYLDLGEYNKLEPLFSRALLLFTKLDSKKSIGISLRGLAIYHLSAMQYDKARNYAEQSVSVLQTENNRTQLRKSYETLSSIHYALHDMKMAESYLHKSDLIGDSISNETVKRNTLIIEKKYETEKKELEIKKLESEKLIQRLSINQKTRLNYFLLSGAATLAIISLLFIRDYKNKQKLQLQRITELETEKQLSATEAVLKGEEQERTRLAKDLHDGLGGMLSGIKYSMNTMKGNLIMTHENSQAFERSMDMLDSSIKEMRRVAHNMMPESLVKFGLDTALKDFCTDINQSGALKVNYQSIGVEGANIDQTISITIYRIVQELINNTMKHAAATNAIVQLSKTNNQLSVTVEDDGKGFDPATLQAAKGIGWTNIQSRVDFLKGRLDVQSAAGQGTSVHIELNA